ncbi:MAG: DUF2461 domain-containing protein [Chloroflexi bacterium]|nr:DUF2461 domain-containing protein [Chloroflexota bacterium]
MPAVSSASTDTERFSGFPDAAVQFLLELQAEQSRAWFKAHQSEFDALCRRPLELFVLELRARLEKDYPGAGEVEPHFFRIQRDTRFARDKSPYKTNVAAELPLRPYAPGEEEHSVPGVYVSFGLDGEFLGVGCWHMQPEALARMRSAIADDKTGPALHKYLDRLLKKGWTVESIEMLKRVPAPYPQDHPRAELLKRKGLALSAHPAEGLAATREFVNWSAQRLREAKPVVLWLDRLVRPKNS